MKNRNEVAAFINAQFSGMAEEMERAKVGRHHYGKQELKALIDFIYGGEPSSEHEKIAVKGQKY